MRLKSAPILKAIYRVTVSMIAIAHSIDPFAALEDDSKVFARLDADKANFAQLRAMAIYLMVVELDIPQAVVAEVVGVSKQAVAKSVRTTEDRLDDPEIQATIDFWADCLREPLL